MDTASDTHQWAHTLAGSPRLLLREQRAPGRPRGAVLYVHGATFPSDCSIMYRFDGRSWADALNEAGFAVYGVDFAGYGGSERYAARPEGDIPGRASEAAEQIGRAVDFIRAAGFERVSLVAHSWGTIAACLFATERPETVGRLVLFGPILRREGSLPRPSGAKRLITIQQQYERFVEDVPQGHAPVLLDRHFASWAPVYLASDPDSGARLPAAVEVPVGPTADIAAAWSGEALYDPARLLAPVLVVRGEWDSLCTDADVAALARAATAAPEMLDVRIAAGTHLMHLEESRYGLHRATNRFLRGEAP